MRNHRMLAVITVAAIALIPGLISPAASHASPTATPLSSSSGRPGYVHHQVSNWTLRIIRAGAKSRVSTNSRWINHRKVRKYFGSMITNRRRFEAGWRKGGGHITNISAAESRAVNRVKNSLTARTMRSQAAQPMLSPNCRGTTKTVDGQIAGNPVFFKSITHQWFNSCDTTKIKYGYESCAAGYGLGMVLVGGNKWMMVLMAIGVFICTVGTAEVSAAQDNSNLNAVIIDTTFKNQAPDIAPEVWSRVRPQ